MNVYFFLLEDMTRSTSSRASALLLGGLLLRRVGVFLIIAQEAFMIGIGKSLSSQPFEYLCYRCRFCKGFLEFLRLLSVHRPGMTRLNAFVEKQGEY